MGCFKLPQSLCDDIDKMMARFFLGGVAAAFNKELLARKWWHLINFEDSLVAPLLKAKYYPHKGPLEASRGHRLSYIWSSIMSSRDLMMDGAIWRVSNGSQIHVYRDRWMQKDGKGMVLAPLEVHEYDKLIFPMQRISVHEVTQLNIKLESLFSQEIARHIDPTNKIIYIHKDNENTTKIIL
ncbi:putative mitochondrial protein [Glycine soja]